MRNGGLSQRLWLLGIMISVGLVASGPAAHAIAFDPDRVDKPLGHVTLQIGEPGSGGGLSVLQIQPPAPDENLQRGEWKWCQSLDDPTCDFSDPKLDIIGTMILPVCDSSDSENCVVNFAMSVGNSTSAAIYLGEGPAGIKWPARPSMNFFKAGSPLLFQIPGFFHGGGADTYAVIATAATRFDFATQRFFTRNISLSVVPYSIIQDARYSIAGAGSGDNNSCIFVGDGFCGVREDFPKAARVSVELRAPSEVAGWFMGRIKDPAVSIDPVSQTNNLMRISAEPAEVARFALVRDPSTLTLADRKAMGNSGSSGSFGGLTIGTAANDETAFGILDYFRSEVGDRASGVNTLWSIGTLQVPLEGCYADTTKVLGVVATNAMVYNGGAPRFENGYLSYKVGGLHYMPNGRDLVVGTYDLLIRSETARCLYGFSKAPISATVQVIGGAGAEKVATTVVSEKEGWVKLAAYGFTFSEKEVRVTISQRQSITLSKFKGNSTLLSATQASQIRGFAAASRSNRLAICTSNYFLSGDKKLAEARAASACSALKRQLPRISTQISTKRVTTRSLDGVTSLSSR